MYKIRNDNAGKITKTTMDDLENLSCEMLYNKILFCIENTIEKNRLTLLQNAK